MNGSAKIPKAPSPERIQQMSFGYAPPLILEAAIDHQVFDHLDNGPRTLEAMVAATGASRRGLRALLDALVGLELLHKRADAYALTDESATFLVSTNSWKVMLIRSQKSRGG
ncbi:MAG: methyltransferase dimerization domain-containing protein [Pirellulales bacterium]|nr:methyltransferase dimerization domain-containing protein [Pirellulales bacterium]